VTSSFVFFIACGFRIKAIFFNNLFVFGLFFIMQAKVQKIIKIKASLGLGDIDLKPAYFEICLTDHSRQTHGLRDVYKI